MKKRVHQSPTNRQYILSAMLALGLMASAATNVSLSTLAGHIMTTDNSYGYMPEAFGKGQEFTLTNDLVGVYALDERTLVARDNENSALPWYCTPDDLVWAEEYAGHLFNYDNPANFEQNNWITIQLPSGKNAADYVGGLIPGNCFTGTIDTHGTFDIVLTATSATYDPIEYRTAFERKNTYSMANFNFNDGLYCNGNLLNESHPSYLVIPKPGEVAIIKWAVYHQAAGTLSTPPNGNGQNIFNYSGLGRADLSYLPQERRRDD